MTTMTLPVSSLTVSEVPIVEGALDRAAVARLVGVKPASISVYMQRSKPGRVYAKVPFPAPNGTWGGRPWWHPDRADEIKRWAAARPGTGSGATGRPRKSQ